MSYSTSILDVVSPYSKLLVIWNKRNPTGDAPLGTCREETLGWSIVTTDTDLILARSSHTEKGKSTVANDLTVIPIQSIVGVQLLDEVELTPVVAQEPAHKASAPSDLCAGMIRGKMIHERMAEDAEQKIREKIYENNPELKSPRLNRRLEESVRVASEMIDRWRKEDNEEDTGLERKAEQSELTSHPPNVRLMESARRVHDMMTTWEREDCEGDTEHAAKEFDPKTPDTDLTPRADRIRLS